MKILAVYLKPKHDEEFETIGIVKKTLAPHKTKFVEKDKAKAKDFIGNDLILTIGGDGTFLQTSHNVLDDTPMFGVNANTKIKDGYYTICNRSDFESVFKKYSQGKVKINSLLRLEAAVDGKVIRERALNEVYMGPNTAFVTSVYHIITPFCDERHKSSGVITSTPTGSHAWAKSAGGKVLKPLDKNFEYVIREPHMGRLTNCQATYGVLNLKQKIKIVSEKNENIIVIDSLSKVYSFREGKTLEIYPSKLHLKAAWPG